MHEVTGNAQLLLGILVGALSRIEDIGYKVVTVDSSNGTFTLKNTTTGSVFDVSIVQTSGSK